MQVLSEQEKRLVMLLTTMENIDFNQIKIILKVNEDEYTIELSRKVSDFDTPSSIIKSRTTKVVIHRKDEERLKLKREYEYQYIKSGEAAGYEGTRVNYYGQEKLLNGEIVYISAHICNHNSEVKDEVDSIIKWRNTLLNSNNAQISRKNSTNLENLDMAVNIDEDKDFTNYFEKSGNLIRLKIRSDLSYLYDQDKKTYYLEKEDEVIPLGKVEINLTSIEEELTKIEASCKKVANWSKDADILNLLWDFSPVKQKHFDRIVSQRKEIVYAKKSIQKALANDYFRDDFSWTDFNDEILEKINNAISEQLVEIETKNSERKAMELLNSLSENERKYIKSLI